MKQKKTQEPKKQEEKVVGVYIKDLRFLVERWETLMRTWEKVQERLQHFEDTLEVSQLIMETSQKEKTKKRFEDLQWVLGSLFEDFQLMKSACRSLYPPDERWWSPDEPLSHIQVGLEIRRELLRKS